MKSKSRSSSKRRRRAAAEKLRIVLAGMDPTVEVSELCRREGISPAELQRRVHELVTQTCGRSGWTVRRTLGALGIAPSSYYRWLREEA